MKHFSYQGKVKKNGFEGWYIRFTDSINNRHYAIIMALTTHENDPHAFIQIFDGFKRTHTYLRYPLSSFKVEDDYIEIAESKLSKTELILKTDILEAHLYLKASLDNPYKSAMGFLEKMPLETFQEVVTLIADFEGTLKKEGQILPVSGRAYMEKTYGKKFPKEWFWLQANHFREPTLSCSLSGGHVPTLIFRPFGFFILITYQGKTYRFATYNLAKLSYEKRGESYRFVIKKGGYSVTLTVSDHDPTELVGPKDNGEMTLPVYESITAHVTLVFKKKNVTLIRDESPYAGFEYMMRG